MNYKNSQNVINITQGEKMKYDSQGFIQISAYTAGGALPVPETQIRISGSEENNTGVEYSVTTDRNGLTDVIALPAPSSSYSLYPNSEEQPYARYNVTASRDGFYEKRVYDVSVFAGIKAVLPLEMIPDAGFARNVSPPSSTNYSIITENEDLK